MNNKEYIRVTAQLAVLRDARNSRQQHLPLDAILQEIF